MVLESGTVIVTRKGTKCRKGTSTEVSSIQEMEKRPLEPLQLGTM